MNERKTTNINLPPQPNPNPTLTINPSDPSIIIYFVLFFLAAILIFFAFDLDKTDWPSLFLNLATELLGAILILIFIERRFKKSEIRYLKKVKQNSITSIITLLFPEARNIVGYARSLDGQFQSVSNPLYFSRPGSEQAFTKNPNGFILIGKAGFGKTTILHRIVMEVAENAIQNPRNSILPIFISVREWQKDKSVTENLCATVRSYYSMSDRIFKRLLLQNRFLCVFDDFHLYGNNAEQQLLDFHNRFPNIPLIISYRSDFSIGTIDLPRMEIPPLSEDEVLKLKELYKTNRTSANVWWMDE